MAELLVKEDSHLVGKMIGKSGLRENDITILTLHRDTEVFPNPKDDRVTGAP